MDLGEQIYSRQVRPVAGSNSEPCVSTVCPVCGASAAEPVFAIENMSARVVQCRECGLGWLDPPPTSSEIASFYPRAYYGDAGAKFSGVIEPLVRLVGSRHARFLARRLAPQARVLDVGC